MSEQRATNRRLRKWILLVILSLAALVLAASLAILFPILTHQSAGGSGWEAPEGFVNETSATGADGRTRTLEVLTVDGQPAELASLAPGEELVVRGTGFDSGIGLYVAICLVPSSPEEKPSPCLGGLPEGATSGGAAGVLASSAWITDDWAWQAFATQGFQDAETGSFETRILVPESAQEGLDCTSSLCAVSTRADHTASSDRVQDMLLPVQFER